MKSSLHIQKTINKSCKHLIPLPFPSYSHIIHHSFIIHLSHLLNFRYSRILLHKNQLLQTRNNEEVLHLHEDMQTRRCGEVLGSKYVMFSTIKSPHPQAIISFLIHYNTIIPLITIKYINPTLWLSIIVFLVFLMIKYVYHDFINEGLITCLCD